ncbi:hypothetical protein GGR42_000110 [Saonia flava]|uniref:GntR family transcriptional regulator n=1 Tax=Saonia flava TaxID=523696 RepID=A0A846QNE5_9FLAO|nr:S1-like domain-containing RNA-binding protein [Saonia flava]NJB69648.1 hypothetical protein [Saonia flava]
MIELGNYNTLKIVRNTSVGLFLEDSEGTDVLLPNKYVPETYEMEDDISVFCYLDYDERPIATTLEPYIIRNTFALLKVVDVNEYGAFLDWGLEKHLLVPFREQRDKMKQGQWYVVYCYMDEMSFRLVGSNKLNKFISNESLTIEPYEEVDIIITRKTDLGWEAIINNAHKGLIFFSDVYKEIAVGDKTKGYIKNIRPDNKIDVSLEPIGFKSLEPSANIIYEAAVKNGGFLNLHDKSNPEEIKRQLQMSKKSFKRGIGVLYKERKIVINENGIKII